MCTDPRPSLISRLSVGALRAPTMATYEPRVPSRTGLYQVSAAHLETLLVLRDDAPKATGLPAYVRREFYDCLQCLAHGFLWLSCDTCHKELLLPFSCKRRGFCPACAVRRMAQTATHLVECVMPWVPNMSASLSLCPPRSRLRAQPLFQVVTDLPRAVHTLWNCLGE